jgi:hypothetical protein
MTAYVVHGLFHVKPVTGSKLFQTGAKDFQAHAKLFQIFRLESPSFSNDSFGGFGRFQWFTRAASAIFRFPNFFAPFVRQTVPFGPGDKAGIGGGGQFLH